MYLFIHYNVSLPLNDNDNKNNNNFCDNDNNNNHHLQNYNVFTKGSLISMIGVLPEGPAIVITPANARYPYTWV